MDIEAYFDRLWPICRSITGPGFRESLQIVSEIVPFEWVEVPSGTDVFDWTVPDEWTIEQAYIEDESGNRLIDMADNNLHVVSYSLPMDEWMDYNSLKKHLHTHPKLPDAIPYMTSYYKPYWGFCLSQQQLRERFAPEGRYHVVIRSQLAPGHLTYGQYVLPATIETEDEIVIASYLCHPSMANNELSGPLTLMRLYELLADQTDRHVNYRFYIGPETIGTIVFLHQWGQHLKQHCQGGLVLTCCGVGDRLHYKKTRESHHLQDRCAEHYLQLLQQHQSADNKVIPFNPMGSDERFYASPGFRIPMGSLIRNIYGQYPEYHSSLDNKALIGFEHIDQTAQVACEIFTEMQANKKYRTLVPYCEPQLGKRNLYFEPCTGSDTITSFDQVGSMLRLLYFSDGEHDLLDIARQSNCTVKQIAEIATVLDQAQLIQPENTQ